MFTHLNQEARLVKVRDFLAMNLSEVVCDRRWYVVIDEFMLHGSLLEVHVVDTVRPLVAPVSNNGFAAELHANKLPPLVVCVALSAYLSDPRKTGLG